jgi:hypothetical protein
VSGDNWLNVGSPHGTPGRRWPPEHALKNDKQAIRYP